MGVKKNINDIDLLQSSSVTVSVGEKKSSRFEPTTASTGVSPEIFISHKRVELYHRIIFFRMLQP